MNVFPLTLGLGSAGLFLATLAPQQALPIPVRSTTNILGNGGFERWDHGSSFQGPIGPVQWLAMGDTSDVFTQGDIAFTPVEGCPPAGDGSVAMQVRANLPNNYVSQSIENFGEYAGLDLTFSLDVRPLFPLANARLEIDDGVTSSMALITVTMGDWGRVTVRHTVADCPTQLEFRIYPEQTIDVDDAMAVVGRQPSLPFVPRPNPEPALREVPLGTVLDWFRFDASIPVPQGFAICDGSAITEVGSPYVGRATPNLSDRFVRGVTSAAAIGSTGGSATHLHTGTTNANQGGFWFQGAFQPDDLHNARDGHVHSFTTNSSSSLPPYVGLLKIVRVK